MCGIAGILRFDSRKVEISQLKTMTDTIVHRGPDGEGQWVNGLGNIGLGHRRLSIIDLSSAGSQPMHYRDERYTITFNGEIYNYVEIREDLVRRGYEFRSHSDTEVLLALYDLKKEKCLADLDGMFSFAVWDEKEQELFCAVDRFGEKPFFYIQNSEYFAFASEMKELWAFSNNREPNHQMIFDYLKYGFTLNPKSPSTTFYKNIQRLEPAHFIKIRRQKVTKSKYWRIDPSKTLDISLEEACEQFKIIFTQSVKRRLRSDVPVGSSLSGGLDSSLVVCVLGQLLQTQGKSVSTFSARFRDFVKDETRYQEYVIDKTRARSFSVYSESDVLDREIDKIFSHQEEPFGSASILVQYQVFQLAKQNNVTVLLDGQGADEILAGYSLYFRTYFSELRKQGAEAYNSQLEKYIQLHGDNLINPPQDQRVTVKTFLKAHLPGLVDVLKTFKKDATIYPTDLMTEEFYRRCYRSVLPSFSYDAKSLNSHLIASTTSYGLSTLLRYADRNSMAHSREVRLPFLSHDLVEFLFSLKSSYKIHNGWTKYIMRKSFEDLLPREIAWRKDKIGYEPPQKEWMNKKEIIERVVEARRKLVQNNILDKKILLQQPKAEAANVKGDKSWEHIMISKLF